jgi:uncharacterized protein YndB with AHSA1/START domain
MLMTRFRTAVEIARPRADVFAYVAEPRHFSEWNSAVTSVVPLDGKRFRMERRLPTGPATNELEIVLSQPPEELVVRTTSGPTPFTYRYVFTESGAGTLLALHAEAKLDGVASLLGPLAGHAVRRGVDANFAALRRILERPEA